MLPLAAAPRRTVDRAGKVTTTEGASASKTYADDMSHVLVRADQTELIGRATAAAAHQIGSRFNPAKEHVVSAGTGKLWAVRGYVVDGDAGGLPLRAGDEVPAVTATRGGRGSRPSCSGCT